MTSLPLAITPVYVDRTTPATPSATAAGSTDRCNCDPGDARPDEACQAAADGAAVLHFRSRTIRVVVETTVREPDQRERTDRRANEPGRRVRHGRTAFVVDSKALGAAGFHRTQRRQKRLLVAAGHVNGVEEKSQLSVPAKMAGGLHESDLPCQLGANREDEFVRRGEHRTSETAASTTVSFVAVW